MEPFSAGAAAVALCPIVISITRELRNAYKKIKYARRDLEELTNEMDIFTDLYTEFLKACSTRKHNRKSVSSAKHKLVSWTQHAIEDFKKLLRKVDALNRDPIYQHTVMETALAKCKWYFITKHLIYLRASLSIARQSIVGFTNICAIELLDEQLAHLKSIMTPQQRQDIMEDYGMTVEERIDELQASRDVYELKQRELPSRLEEAEENVKAHAKYSKNKGDVRQRRRVLDFSESVDRYAERVLPLDEAGNRPPCPAWHSSKRSRSHRHDSSRTSQSTATTPTSTQSSHYQRSAPESPPTSPEPTHEDPTDEEAPPSTLNFCRRCKGTCTSTKAHGNCISCTPSEPASHISLVVPPVVPRGPLKPKRNRTRGRASSCPTPRRTLPSSREPSIQSSNEASPRPLINPVIHEADEDDLEDGTSEEEEAMDKQARDTGPSIWQSTGGFEGHMPRGLRVRRQRSQSPQDFW